MLNITGVKPMFNNILTTMNKYEKDEYENGIMNEKYYTEVWIRIKKIIII